MLPAARMFRPRAVTALVAILCLGACAQFGSTPTAQSIQGQYLKGLDVTARGPQTIRTAGTVQPPSSTGSQQAQIWDGDAVNREAVAEADGPRPKLTASPGVGQH
jgi:hypothetical protein